MLTIKELLGIKGIEGIKIVAGEKGIHNKISIVNIIENPDVFDWLNANELLLSTGYIFKDNETLQNRVIHELIENNCAGLCIKMKRYFDKLPQNMIDLANQHGFPLLELPFEYTLSKVIAIINERTKMDYDGLNRKSLDLHNDLLKIALEGGGLEQIAAELADTIHNPVVILDQDWNLLSYTDYKENELPLHKILHFAKNKAVFPAEFTDAIPRYISEIKKSIKRIYQHNGYELTCRIMPVAVSNYVYGYIVVLQTVRKLEEFDYLALDQVSTILALDRIKAREIEEIRLKIRHDFFDDLLAGNITSAETVRTLSEKYGLKAGYSYYCLLIHIAPDKLEHYEDMVLRKYELDHTAKKCVQLIYDGAGGTHGELTCYAKSHQIIVLVGKSENKPPITAGEAKSFAAGLYEQLVQKIKDTTFIIGVGGQYKTIHSVSQSFFEAREAIRLMQRFNDGREVAHFEDYAVYHFLDSNIKPPEMESYFKKVLGAVHDYDLAFGTSLLNTLEFYFLHNRNVSEAAKAMFIHRNTFIYRMDKIKELLNADLKNADEGFQIQVALKLYRLLNKG